MLVTGPSQSMGSIPCGLFCSTGLKLIWTTSNYNYINEGDPPGSSHLRRAVAIRFGAIRLVVRAQECYTVGGSGGMLPQENFEIQGL